MSRSPIIFLVVAPKHHADVPVDSPSLKVHTPGRLPTGYQCPACANYRPTHRAEPSTAEGVR